MKTLVYAGSNPALTTKQKINMETKKSYPNYIGKKIKGFKFESTKDVSWLEEKSSYIGRIGEITCQDIYRVGVHFDDYYWYYLIDLVEQHLVEEEPRLEMKTPMQELIEKLNSVKPTQFCSIETIKGWTEGMFEKEKDIIEYIIDIIDSENSGQSAEQRLDEIKTYLLTFNTKEK